MKRKHELPARQCRASSFIRKGGLVGMRNLQYTLFWFYFRMIFLIHAVHLYLGDTLHAFYIYPSVHFSFLPSWLTFSKHSTSEVIVEFTEQLTHTHPSQTMLYILFVIIFLVVGQLILGMLQVNQYRKSVILRIGNLVIFVGYAILFISEKSLYNNHHYLYLLIWFILWLTDPAFGSNINEQTQNLHLLQFQVAIVYFYAGLAKLTSSDWMTAFEPLKTWIWTGSPFRVPFIISYVINNSFGVAFLRKFVPDMILLDRSVVFSSLESINLVHITSGIMSYGSMLIDLVSGVILLYDLLPWNQSTRIGSIKKALFILLAIFHCGNAILFDIGTFPFLMLGTTILWWIPFISFNNNSNEEMLKNNSSKTPSADRVFRSTLICMFVIIQILVPLRCYLPPNDVNWTNNGHYFSWRMMMNEEVSLTRWRVTDNSSISVNGEPTIYLLNSLPPDKNSLRMIPHQRFKLGLDPDMIQHFARVFILPYVATRYSVNPSDATVTVDSWRSVNGRPFERWIRSDVDLVQNNIPTDIFGLPNYSAWIHQKIVEIDDEIMSEVNQAKLYWNKKGFEIVLFADRLHNEWEGFFMDFANDFQIVIIRGEVSIYSENSDKEYILNSNGKSIRAPVSFGDRHYVNTLSEFSIWGYVYTRASFSFIEASMML